MDKRSEILNRGLKGFIVTCAECGKKRNPFLFQGITGSQAIPREHVTSVISLLKAGDLHDLYDCHSDGSQN